MNGSSRKSPATPPVRRSLRASSIANKAALEHRIRKEMEKKVCVQNFFFSLELECVWLALIVTRLALGEITKKRKITPTRPYAGGKVSRGTKDGTRKPGMASQFRQVGVGKEETSH